MTSAPVSQQSIPAERSLAGPLVSSFVFGRSTRQMVVQHSRPMTAPFPWRYRHCLTSDCETPAGSSEGPAEMTSLLLITPLAVGVSPLVVV